MSVELKKSEFTAKLAEGATVKEMAKHFSVTEKVIRDGAKHWGINLRSKPVKSKMVNFIDDTQDTTSTTTNNMEGELFTTAPQTVTIDED